MTDKQTIIDYENLCENYSKVVGCYITFDGSCNKEQCFTYRLLQLLKAKEQECEEKSWEIGNLGYKIKNQRKEINIRLQQLDQLKAENDELRNFHINLVGVKECNIRELLKLKQTLTEIKEIAKKAKKDICNNCGWRNTDSCDPEDYTCREFIKILQKISEVEEQC